MAEYGQDQPWDRVDHNLDPNVFNNHFNNREIATVKCNANSRQIRAHITRKSSTKNILEGMNV